MTSKFAALAAALLLAGRFTLRPGEDRVRFHALRSRRRSRRGHPRRLQSGGEHLGGKLGGLPAQVIVADDQQNPDVASRPSTSS